MIAGSRSINYLRISVTDRCNFRCRYCVPAAPFSVMPHHEIARYEEILKITRLACDMGITKVRITGGEPFVRKDIFSFIEQLCAIDTLSDISITTNGALLTRDKIQTLIDLGIKRLNFSLDTLDPDRFAAITGRDRFKKVWDAIMTAHALGITPVKINTVVLRGINDDEIVTIAGLTRKFPFHIRFIEYMPMGDLHVEKQQPQMLTSEIRRRIEAGIGPLTPLTHKAGDGPAKKFQLADAPGVVGFITPISSHFCSECNRLRLTSRGFLRPCLLNDYEKDILTPLRKGATDAQLKEIIQAALKHKPLFHTLGKNRLKDIPVSHMTSIGG
ncbi:MAG: GTP 3',8-cyclase MoaA [Desulfotignum sp.]|nr:GTP 3',8-cyclase MoaA [Desulfotignum sp.]MCF8112397.1 GTP 3',8-cyclase MoaA [Desulfotignum sp.]MCF8125229.1 GTP 3',8-cyclase MoaA [Desulfotignum sp.]